MIVPLFREKNNELFLLIKDKFTEAKRYSLEIKT